MKQFAEKTHRPVSGSPNIDGAGHGSALNDFFGGWLDSVAPELSKAPLQVSSARRRGFQHSITANDLVRVNRATVRESNAHRHWPPDVVAQFLTAEVITRKNKQTP